MVEMRFPEVDTCCFVMSLRSGAKLVGLISMVTNLVMFISMGFVISLIAYYTDPGGLKYLHSYTVYLLELIALCHFLHMLVALVLILGVYQAKPRLMLWWLIPTFVISSLDFVFMVVTVFPRSTSVEAMSIKIDYIFTIFMFINNVCGCFVVYSHFRKLTPQPASVV